MKTGLRMPRYGGGVILLAVLITACRGSGPQGQISGGGGPIKGATMTLYAMTANGYGAAAMALATTTSDTDGHFKFTANGTCPANNPQTYVVGTHGDAGSGTNVAIGLVALSGPCMNLSNTTFVALNELTTAAAEYALARFSDASGTNFGTSSSNLTGLNNSIDAAEANLVISYASNGGAIGNVGIPSRFLPWSPSSRRCTADANCDALERLNTVANIVAACVGGSGIASAACDALITNTNNSVTTLAAAHFIATHPTLNISALFALQPAPSTAPYTPALDEEPADLSLALNFAPADADFHEPYGVAIDASGNVWIANYNGKSVTEMNSSGGVIANYNNTNVSGANFNNPIALAFDTSGNVWVANYLGPGVTELSSSGKLVAHFDSGDTTGADFAEPIAIALDGTGGVWVVNFNNNSVTKLDTDGTVVGNFHPDGADFDQPFSVAIDSTGDAWIPNFKGNTITRLSPDGELVGKYSPGGSKFDGPNFVAIDASNNAWISNYTGNTVTELNSGGDLVGNYDASAAEFDQPYAEAIDGSGNLWVANQTNNGVTELSSNGDVVGNYNPSGAAFKEPYGIAIDASGNVWVTDLESNSLSELVGAANPVLTPMVACLAKTSPAAVCSP